MFPKLDISIRSVVNWIFIESIFIVALCQTMFSEQNIRMMFSMVPLSYISLAELSTRLLPPVNFEL